MAERIELPSFLTTRFPNYHSDAMEWAEWRLCYEGGKDFRQKFLKQFSTRETTEDYNRRLDLTPIPTFAKAALNEVRNSIFQRFCDITRTGGSKSYQEAIAGTDGGVDGCGATMNSFIGQQILTELMITGRVGIYVDMPVVEGGTLLDANGKMPYLYSYCVEDILNWAMDPEHPGDFQSILLRDTVTNYDQETLMAINTASRYRKVWKDRVTGQVKLQFYNVEGLAVDRNGNLSNTPYELELTRVPFVMPSIGDSLIKDATTQQIALLNIGSTDVAYALQSNFPFYTEQKDMRSVGGHLKRVANEDGTATQGGQAGSDEAVKVGVTNGRYYDMNAERPAFINPSSEPLKASMELQAKLEADIRKLINLAVQNVASRASAESKTMDNAGLNAGLSFIGLVLQAAEMKIASFWAAYENKVESKRLIAVIKYPEQYSIKSDRERLEEGKELNELMSKLPSRTAKREIGKVIATTLFGTRVKVDTLRTIHSEIDKADFTTSDPDVIIAAHQDGLVGDKTASVALGFNEDEYKQAQDDHMARTLRIAEAQGQMNTAKQGDEAARGRPDMSANPAKGKSEELAASRDITMKYDTKPPVRGEGK